HLEGLVFLDANGRHQSVVQFVATDGTHPVVAPESPGTSGRTIETIEARQTRRAKEYIPRRFAAPTGIAAAG
ncbi:MAG: hypothetical protein ACK58C_01470, partial [Betaproteobacteria bacterium]